MRPRVTVDDPGPTPGMRSIIITMRSHGTLSECPMPGLLNKTVPVRSNCQIRPGCHVDGQYLGPRSFWCNKNTKLRARGGFSRGLHLQARLKVNKGQGGPIAQSDLESERGSQVRSGHWPAGRVLASPGSLSLGAVT